MHVKFQIAGIDLKESEAKTLLDCRAADQSAAAPQVGKALLPRVVAQVRAKRRGQERLAVELSSKTEREEHQPQISSCGKVKTTCLQGRC